RLLDERPERPAAGATPEPARRRLPAFRAREDRRRRLSHEASLGPGPDAESCRNRDDFLTADAYDRMSADRPRARVPELPPLHRRCGGEPAHPLPVVAPVPGTPQLPRRPGLQHAARRDPAARLSVAAPLEQPVLRLEPRLVARPPPDRLHAREP